MHIQYAMVFVSAMQQATAFYRDVLGLPLKFESPESGPDGMLFSVGEPPSA